MMPPIRHNVLIRLSPRHARGLFMLALVFLAESVTVSNAVNEWTRPNSPFGGGGTSSNGGGGKHHHQQQACPAAPVLSRMFPRRGRFQNRYPDECCMDCSHCMNPVDVCETIHRGGHMQTQTTAAEAVAAVAKTPYGIPLHLWKVIFQTILTTINVLCWLIPLRSKQISDNKLALSLANAFSGGVFLSLAFGHLIPECVHGFDASTPEAMPYILVLVGYLLIFFVEKVAFDAHDILHEMEHRSETAQLVNGNKEESSESSTNHVVAAPQASSGRSAVILLGALAVHSVLEMMALGLSNTFGDSALLTLSIALHQPAESIALLVAFLKSGMPKDDILRYLSIFSCMGPVGVALGMAVKEMAAPIVDSIMLAIVAGTFVYVGATEVIPEEWEDSSHKWKKFAALMSGIVSILVITQYTMSLNS